MSAARERLEAFLERELPQLPPWFVVGFGAGIAAWFALDTPSHWMALLAIAGGVAIAGFTARGGRAERAAGWFALALVLGCALVWVRSAWVAAPRLERPVITAFEARVERVDSSGFDGEPLQLQSASGAHCSRDSCIADLERQGAAGGCWPPGRPTCSRGWTWCAPAPRRMSSSPTAGFRPPARRAG